MKFFKKIVENKITIIWFYDLYKETNHFNVKKLKNACCNKIANYIPKIGMFSNCKIKRFVYNFLSGIFAFQGGGFSSAESLFSQNESVKYDNIYWDNISLYYAAISCMCGKVSDSFVIGKSKKLKSELKKQCNKYLRRMSIDIRFNDLNTFDNIYYKQTQEITNLLACIFNQNHVRGMQYDLIKSPFLINFVLLCEIKVNIDKKSERVLLSELLHLDDSRKFSLYKNHLTYNHKFYIFQHSKVLMYKKYKNALISWMNKLSVESRLSILMNVKDDFIVSSILNKLSLAKLKNIINRCPTDSLLYVKLERFLLTDNLGLYVGEKTFRL